MLNDTYYEIFNAGTRAKINTVSSEPDPKKWADRYNCAIEVLKCRVVGVALPSEEIEAESLKGEE